MRVRIFLIFMLLLAFASATQAQTTTEDPAPAPVDDGREDPRPGDRVILYCRAGFVEVWGSDNTGNGVFLANLNYADMLTEGGTTQNTNVGQVVGFADSSGFLTVRWIGGPYHASGFGDFSKQVTCDGVIGLTVPTSGTTTDTTVPTTTATGTQITVTQQVTIDGTTTTQTQTVTTDTGTCTGDTYTVRAGDNLFRISLRFGVSLNALAACNNIGDISLIYAGQRLVIP